MKMYGICCFVFSTVWKIFVLFAEISFFFFNNYWTVFHKNGTNGQTGFSSMCLHSSLVSFHFTLRSTALESFSRGIFDFTDLFLIFAFSQILNTQIWDECLNKQKQSIAIYLRFTAFESFSGVFLAFWLILKFFSKNYPVKWDKGFNRKCESSLCKQLCPFFKTFFFKN